MTSWLIDTGYGCWWVEMDGDRVVKAPPIARWMKGKTYDHVRGWITAHGYTMIEVP